MHLNSDTVLVHATQRVLLTATADASVTGTDDAIEIFDLTSHTMAGACVHGSQCMVDYSAGPSRREFVAYIAAPGETASSDALMISSNHLTVEWVGVRLTAQMSAVGPGKPLTVTAVTTASAPTRAGYALQVYETSTKHRLGYCGEGNTCSLTLAQANPGSRSIVAVLGKPSLTMPATDVRGQSDPMTVTWLAASIAAAAAYQIGDTVHITATTNTDLSGTPWSLGITDDQGHVLALPCKSGHSCSAEVTVAPGPTPIYSAVVGVARRPTGPGPLGQLVNKFLPPAPLRDVQAKSNTVRPTRLLWGVDSCKSITDDPSAGSGLYRQIVGSLGKPDFWGRYLTQTVCPGISSAEIAAAHHMHLGILPIYNDYLCSNVVGYDTARGYAAEAAAAARALSIPEGTGLAIDIEPPGAACPGAANLDSGFIQGWVDGMSEAHYVPIFYGNGTASSEFGTQWCVAVNAVPQIAERSFVWSFEPSLLDGFGRGNAPGFGPFMPGCPGHTVAWQYQIGSNSSVPDVDQDEALSELPLWYP